MQPQTIPTNPAANDAGPKPPAPAAPLPQPPSAPEPLTPMKAEMSTGMSVAPAPPEGAAGQIPSTKKGAATEVSGQTAAKKTEPKKKAAAGGHTLPLALISVTIMVMLLLATLAVIVYLTTRSS